MSNISLALDAGQTGIKSRIICEGTSGEDLVLPGVRTHEPLIPQLAAAAHKLADGIKISTLAVGSTGLTEEIYDANLLHEAVRDLSVVRVLLTHDAVTSYLGALGEHYGVVVAAGTGVVTLAVGELGVTRVDGWGHIMGDAGSGYWIGRAVLEAVMRAHDGRDPKTALSDVVKERWPKLESAYLSLQADPDRVSIVASFAHSAALLAKTDATAERICKEAAEQLALSAVTALRRVSNEPALKVSAIGGVFRAEIIRRTFEEQVRAAHPDAYFVAPQGTGLDGATALLTLGGDHQLRALISESGSSGLRGM